MGQYYKTITESNGKRKVYSRHYIDNGQREYMVAKLMEHSWWTNTCVEAVCKDIYERAERTRVAWMGDYAINYLECIGLKRWNWLKQEQIEELYHQCWDNEGDDVEIPDFTLAGKYLVNHTKGVYIDCDAYYKRSAMKYGKQIWCIHPLPLLTCIGNGMGGGDYRAPTENSSFEEVGTWAWDEISIDDEAPDIYSEQNITFKERGWEE